jgi:hypothetical protein
VAQKPTVGRSEGSASLYIYDESAWHTGYGGEEKMTRATACQKSEFLPHGWARLIPARLGDMLGGAGGDPQQALHDATSDA